MPPATSSLCCISDTNACWRRWCFFPPGLVFTSGNAVLYSRGTLSAPEEAFCLCASLRSFAFRAFVPARRSCFPLSVRLILRPTVISVVASELRLREKYTCPLRPRQRFTTFRAWMRNLYFCCFQFGQLIIQRSPCTRNYAEIVILPFGYLVRILQARECNRDPLNANVSTAITQNFAGLGRRQMALVILNDVGSE